MFRLFNLPVPLAILWRCILLIFLAFGDIPIGLCFAALFLFVVLLLGCCWKMLTRLNIRLQQLIIWRVTYLLKGLEKGLKGPRLTCWQVIIRRNPISWP